MAKVEYFCSISYYSIANDIPSFAISYRMSSCRSCATHYSSGPSRSLPMECPTENRRCYYAVPPSSPYSPSYSSPLSEDAQFLDKLQLCPRECLTIPTHLTQSIYFSVCLQLRLATPLCPMLACLIM